jgi:hypothetical protein
VLRTMLRLSVVMALLSLIVLTVKVRYVWMFDLAVLIAVLRNRRVILHSHGSARWADAKDMGGMIHEE